MVKICNSTKKEMALLFALLLSISTQFVSAQQTPDPIQILDKAMGFDMEQNSGAVYYESIAYGLKDPMQIFSLPAYQVYKGGHWIFNGEQFEIQAGTLKALSDGKLMVLIDEESKLMYIDSLQRENLIEDEELPDVDQLLDQHFGTGKMEYMGEEEVQGVKHVKIKSELEKLNNSYTLYWINPKTGKLNLMAEYMEGSYTAYLIKITGRAPKDYDFTINVPNNEISDFYGYVVVDMRFTYDMLNATINSNNNY